MFYDEQPTSIRISIRQRIRWSKGHLQAFVQTGPKLIWKVLVGNLVLQYKKGIPEDERGDVNYKEMSKMRILLEEIRVRWAAFDTFAQLLPQVIIKLFMWIIVSLILYAFYNAKNGYTDLYVFAGGNTLAKILRKLTGATKVSMKPGLLATISGLGLCVLWRIIMRISTDLKNVFYGIYLFFIERKRIKKIPLFKKICYCFTWTTFDILYRYSMYMALFMKVEWKVIPHTSNITIDDIKKDVQ